MKQPPEMEKGFPGPTSAQDVLFKVGAGTHEGLLFLFRIRGFT